MKRGANFRRKGAREVAVDILTAVETKASYSHLALNEMLQKAGLERKEADFATEMVYGTIQRLNTLDYFLGRYVDKGLDKLEPWVKNLLRISLYQLYYLDKIPVHALVHEAVRIAKQKGHQGIAGLVNGVLRNILRDPGGLIIPENLNPVQRISLVHSHPQWLVELWFSEFGEETTERICAANNDRPRFSVRVNTLKNDRKMLLDALQKEGIDAEPSILSPFGIIVRGAGNLGHTKWYREGNLSVQDESSMLVAEILDPRPGMRVLDCCAAPGGKTAHMAELMGNHGEIWACDVHAHKEKLILAQARRVGAECVRTLTLDARHLPQRFMAETFDRILLDAPCSGLGVIRRKPEIKWRKSAEDLYSLSRLQSELLDKVCGLLKPGGILVYSTCTIHRRENGDVIGAFLKSHPDFSLDEQFTKDIRPPLQKAVAGPGMLQILPHHFHTDGFFIARIRRNA